MTDNPALCRALKNSDTWRCVFIIDPSNVGSSNQGVNKWRFLLQSLEDLDQGNTLLNINQHVYCLCTRKVETLINARYSFFFKQEGNFPSIRVVY